MPGMDVFNANAFKMQSLTARLLDQPHVPGRLAQLGLFSPRPVRTTDVSVERKGNTLVLVQTSPRGGPAPQSQKDLRNIFRLPTVRIALDDVIMADEVQNIRSFGSEDSVKSLQEEVDERAMRLSRSIDATEEYHRVGALNGLILDADGSTILDLYTQFGVAAQSEVDFDLDNASPASGALRKKCAGVIRTIEDELGGLPFDHVHAICSSAFWDDLIAHTEVRETVKNWPAALTLRETGVSRDHAGRPVKILDFGGITFEEYRGSVGGTAYVAADKVRVFPVGVPELYVSAYGPAEYFDTVNTLGLPRYARMNPDGTDGDQRRTLRVQAQTLSFMTRPRAMVPGKRT